MRTLIFIAAFFLAMQSPLSAENTVFLNELSKKNQMGFTRLTLDFSSLPSCQVKTYGQRVDLRFRGVDLGSKFRNLPEDDAIIRVILAHNNGDLVLSILFRKLPVKVETTPVASTDQLYVDIHWEEKKARPVRLAVDMRTRELPLITGDGQAHVGQEKSKYAGNWKEFFYAYQAVPQIKAPIKFSLPELPAFPEKLADGELREVLGVARNEGWAVIESLLAMKAETNSELKKNDVFQAILMEARVRTGQYGAILVDTFEPKEPELHSRCWYFKNFARAASANLYLAKTDLDLELGRMQEADRFRPYFLLLQAEIALARDSNHEAGQYLSENKVAWEGELENIRRLRMVDSQKHEALPSTPAPSTAPVAEETVTKTEIKTVPGQTTTVHKGDSWWSLAKRFGTTVAELKKLNNVSGNILQIGQTIMVSPSKEVEVLKEVLAEAKPAQKEVLNPYAPFLKDHTVFFKKPFSLCRAADLFLQQGKVNEALFLYEKAKPILDEGDLKALVEFSIARLLKAVGKKDMAYEKLTGLAIQETAAEAVLRARLALQEDLMQESQLFGFLPMAQEYEVVARQARLRDLREAAAFKSALALYFGGEKEKSVQAFDEFKKNFSAGKLVSEVDAFLSEKLPSLIVEMVIKKRDFEAVVMLDKHREILLARQNDRTFLFHLADSMTRLGLMNRAAKIYLFLLENYRGRDEEKLFYLPLVKTYMERHEYPAAADFAGRYLERFPQAADWRELLYLQLLANQKGMRLDEAIAAWEKFQDRADSRARIVAAQVFWEKGRYGDVLDCLEIEPAGGETYPPAILILKAESYLKEKRTKEALVLFQELAKIEEFSQHSLYRCAQIALATGHENEALNYLSQVVEKGEKGVWYDLARTSMTGMRM